MQRIETGIIELMPGVYSDATCETLTIDLGALLTATGHANDTYTRKCRIEAIVDDLHSLFPSLPVYLSDTNECPSCHEPLDDMAARSCGTPALHPAALMGAWIDQAVA